MLKGGSALIWNSICSPGARVVFPGEEILIHGMFVQDSYRILSIFPMPLLVSLTAFVTLCPGFTPSCIPLGSVTGRGTAGLKFSFMAVEAKAPSLQLKSTSYSAVSELSRGTLKLTVTLLLSFSPSTLLRFEVSSTARTLLPGEILRRTALTPVSVLPNQAAFLIETVFENW